MFIGQPLFIILTSPVMLSTLTEYFVYPATLLSSPALVRKEDTFTSASGYDLISPALMPENASFMQPLRRPYFCLFFVVLIFSVFDCGSAGIEPASEAVTSYAVRPRAIRYTMSRLPHYSRRSQVYSLLPRLPDAFGVLIYGLCGH